MLPPKPGTWPITAKAWQRLHMDFMYFNGVPIFVLNDVHTKWIEAVPMNKTDSSAVRKVLTNIFSTHGLPDTIVSDNGPPFRSYELKNFFAQNGIQQCFSATYHPATNGSAERSVQTVKRGIKKLRGSVEERLTKFLQRYRSTPCPTTGISPAEALIGRRVKTRLDSLRPVPITPCEGESLEGRNFKTGDIILARNYLGEKKWLHATVLTKLGSKHYLVKLNTSGITLKRHVDQLLYIRTPKPNETEKFIDSDESKIIPDFGKGFWYRLRSLKTNTTPPRRSTRIRHPPQRFEAQW